MPRVPACHVRHRISHTYVPRKRPCCAQQAWVRLVKELCYNFVHTCMPQNATTSEWTSEWTNSQRAMARVCSSHSLTRRELHESTPSQGYEINAHALPCAQCKHSSACGNTVNMRAGEGGKGRSCQRACRWSRLTSPFHWLICVEDDAVNVFNEGQHPPEHA